VAADTAGVLDAIDNALEDWEVSGDAMRWNPEPRRVICDGGVLWPQRRDPPVAAASVTTAADEIAIGSLPFRRLGGITMTVTLDASPACAALDAMAAAAGNAASEWVRAAHRTDAAFRPRAHIRCRACNPGANPVRLPVDGQAYRRKQLARKRRSR
jgi:hypothetical protein